MHPATEPRRVAGTDRAPHCERPVTLLPDRAEETEQTTRSDPARPSRKGRDRVGLSKGGISPRDEAVTYRLVPGFLGPAQARVFDRRSGDAVREVPRVAAIELAVRYETYVGNLLDTLA